MEDPKIHTLARADVSTGIVLTEDGRKVEMLKLHLWVHVHGHGADELPHSLEPIWIDPTAASVLIHGLNAKMKSSFSARLQADDDAAQSKPQ